MQYQRYIVTIPVELALNRHDWAMASAVLPYLFSRLMDVDFILGVTPLYGEEVVQDVLETPELSALLIAVDHQPSRELEYRFAAIAEHVGGLLANIARRLPGVLKCVHRVEIIDPITFRLEFAPRLQRNHHV